MCSRGRRKSSISARVQISPSNETPARRVKPFLSIVLTGRNDEHGTDFRARFFRTLRFNIHQLDALQIPYEIVFVEWAPAPERPRLVDIVSTEVAGVSRDNFVGYVVDPRYHR